MSEPKSKSAHSKKNKKKFEKRLDKQPQVWYNINTVREGKPNKPERNTTL